MNNFLYWITNPVWIGGTLAVSCIGAVEVFFNHGNTLSTPVLYIVVLAFVWLSIVAAIRRSARASGCRRRGRSPGSWCSGCSRSRSSSTRLKHGAHGLGREQLHAVGYAGFVLLIGVLLFNFVGFELPNSAGEEMTNPQRDVPFAIARSAIGSVILYALPVLGILVVLPSSAITNFSGFTSAMQDVFTVYGGTSPRRHGHADRAGLALGDLFAVLFILCLLTSGVDLDHGLGPGAGRVLLRRLGPAVPRRHQREVRHPGPGQRLQRHRRVTRRRPGATSSPAATRPSTSPRCWPSRSPRR